MFRIALLLVFSVCVVNSDDGYNYSRSYARVKRGRYPGPPLRFYNRPPPSFSINGPFSYTPPPFMAEEEAPYPGSRPYKVSKRPTNTPDGLGDDDINNLVQHLTKQDLDKILEFAYDKDKYNEKSKYVDYKYSQSQKKENIVKPTYTKDYFRGNIEPSNNFHYQNDNPYEKEMIRYVNYVTQATPVKYEFQDDRPNPYDFKVSQSKYPNFPEPSNSDIPDTNPNNAEPSNSNIPETNEEEKLPLPLNMRTGDYDASYTNNVPTVVEAEPSSSYKLENFGDLPLMDYNSKLHSVSSYHVPHYTVTQPKPAPRPQPEQYTQTFSSSSSSLLKPSPAAAAIKAPPYEPAPPASAARDQSDAHLKATKIWSHRSKGAAYTLHDDGTLTPERPWRQG